MLTSTILLAVLLLLQLWLPFHLCACAALQYLDDIGRYHDELENGELHLLSSAWANTSGGHKLSSGL